MIRKIYNKIKQKQVIEYLLWKLGLKTLVKNITKNYWNAGKIMNGFIIYLKMKKI